MQIVELTVKCRRRAEQMQDECRVLQEDINGGPDSFDEGMVLGNPDDGTMVVITYSGITERLVTGMVNHCGYIIIKREEVK
jgi:hypothetical protein